MKAFLASLFVAFQMIPLFADADVTVTSSFSITNKTITAEKVNSTELSMSYSKAGNGYYTIVDANTDVNYNYPQSAVSLYRTTSVTPITMIGQRTGYRFTLYGKLGETTANFNGTRGNRYFNGAKGSNCINSAPDSLNANHTIKTSDDNNGSVDCKNSYLTIYVWDTLKINGVRRTYHLDLASLLNDSAYIKAPLDVYIGSSTNSGQNIIRETLATVRTSYYKNNVTIYKKPYFDSVTFSASEGKFTTLAIGQKIIGSVTVPYLLSGKFTPYDRITLNVSSKNGFSLVNGADNSKRIPYSLSTTLGVRKYNLVNSGVSLGGAIFTNLPENTNAIQGRFDADFSVSKATVINGDYVDTLTAIYQIDLVS
ncbi:hypothetical protein [Edwardsiella tarda]